MISNPIETRVQGLPYETPRLRSIELLTDEVLGIGCKTQNVTGPDPNASLNPCLASGCYSNGS